MTMASQEEDSTGGRRRVDQHDLDDEEQVQVHALAVPYPAQGHILPLINLCHRLTTLIPHLCITFVNTSLNHRRMFDSHHHLHKKERIRLVEIDGGLPPEMHKHRQSMDTIYKASENLITPLGLLLESLMLSQHPISFILSDGIMSWTQSLANKFGIPRVAFLPFSASNFYVCTQLQSIMAELPSQDKSGAWDREVFESNSILLPSSAPALSPVHLNEILILHECRILYASLGFFTRQFPLMREASLILSNSLYELEKPVFEALKISWPAPVQPIGPLLPMPAFKMPTLYKEERSCLAWLDRQSKPKSVLYVSFGSIHELAGKQFHELALGLEASQHPFLWIIRDDSKKEKEKEGKMFPDSGFLDRVGDRCLIVSWCPQLEVLSHPSVGAFLTHCGWNSVMESVASGVPMACWPYTGEQRLNARFVVEQWKVGMRFKSQEKGMVGRTEIERVVRAVIEDKGIQKTALEKSQVAKASVMKGGSSYTNLEAFIDGISAMNNSSTRSNGGAGAQDLL